MRNSRTIAIALWANAGLLAGILLMLAAGGIRRPPDFLPAAFGQAQMPLAGGAGVYVMPGQFTRDTFGCYLMDVDAQTLCVYQWFPAERQLRLVAARGFQYDRRLRQFNSESPSPADVKELIEREAAGVRGHPATQE